MTNDRFGNYQILRRPDGTLWEIAKGVHATTYKAQDTLLDMPVVLSVIEAEAVADEQSIERFKRTLRTFLTMQHDHVAQFLHGGWANDQCYFVTKYYRGELLVDRVNKGGPLPWKEAIRIAAAIASAFVAVFDATRAAVGEYGVVDGAFNASRVLLTERAGTRVIGFDLVSETPYSSATAQAIRSLATTLLFMLTGSEIERASEAYPSAGPPNIIPLQRSPAPVRDLVERMLSDTLHNVTLAEWQQALMALVEELPPPPFLTIPGPSEFTRLLPTETPGPSSDAPPHTLDENIQFTAYRPKVVQPAKWNTMLVFTHLDDRPAWMDESERGPIEEMEAQARQILGSKIDEYRESTTDSSLAIPRDGEITLAPEIGGFEFNPPRRSFLWKDGVAVHAETFSMRAGIALDGHVARGRLTVFLGHLILAEISLSIRVASGAAVRSGTTADATPAQSSARPFRRVFASYSHDDLAVVAAVESHTRSLGDEYLRDWVNLRSGEQWNERLLEMINEADVFQLFWSKNAAQSEFVTQEWKHALQLRRPAFVRPTYWEVPMPKPPELLQGIHFHRLTAATAPTPTNSKTPVVVRISREMPATEPYIPKVSATPKSSSAATTQDVAASPGSYYTPGNSSPTEKSVSASRSPVLAIAIGFLLVVIVVAFMWFRAT